MTNTRLNEAVKIIAEEYRADCMEYDVTISGFFKAMQYDTEDLKEEFFYILSHSDFKGEFTDECEISEDSDNTVHTFRELSMCVRKYQFN